MDFPSIHFQEQKDLHSSYMVQGPGLFSFPRGMLYGCGDLIFSSHMIFSLVFVRTYHKYGTQRFIKQCAWLTVVVQSLLIITSRKHYTVDVVVAWYTVNLVVFYIDSKLPELPDHSAAALLLPVTKDSWTKEENHKLLNGNAGDPTDRRLRSQVNGKAVEDGNILLAETVMNMCMLNLGLGERGNSPTHDPCST